MKAVVCGTGPSLQELVGVEHDALVVGVNDIELHGVTPDHLVVVARSAEFELSETEAIVNSAATKVWVINNPGWASLLKRRGDDVHVISEFTFAGNQEITEAQLDGPLLRDIFSPLVAAHLAYKLGATRIGVIGVDVTKDHPLSPDAARIGTKLQELGAAVRARDVEMVNLSPTSRIREYLPFCSLTEFLG